ncbi:MAG: class I SAM-dependent methyltransferase [Proteobacteria bacterium]|nr:class I SAM-dependent methyltransferase [Pseudomonadota bacterium]
MRQIKPPPVVLAACCTNAAELKRKFEALPSTVYGVRASAPGLDELMPMFLKPPVSVTGKSLLTVNKMGFDVLSNPQSQYNWLLKDFYSFIAIMPGIILDAACGYGNIALDTLAIGNIVIANDIAVEHLIEVRRRAIERNLATTHLYLNNKPFPYGIDLPSDSLKGAMFHRGPHLFSPKELEDGFALIHKWLQPGGKLFIVAMAPQHKSFADWFLPIYEERWTNGDKWPGTNLDVKKALPDQAYNLPEHLHVMDERPLRYALEKCGFKIKKVGFIDMKHFGKATENRDGHEAIGVIAVKKLWSESVNAGHAQERAKL